MVVAALALNARRAAMLLRCQNAREGRCRRERDVAERVAEAAATTERDARDAEAVALADADERLRHAYERLRGQVVGPADLAELPALERALAVEAAERRRAVAAAIDATAAARLTAAATGVALLAEARRSESRSNLVDRYEALWRRATDAAEEQERDDEVADTWRSS